MLESLITKVLPMGHPIADRLEPLGTLNKAILSIMPKKGIAVLSSGRLLSLWLGRRGSLSTFRSGNSEAKRGLLEVDGRKLMVGPLAERCKGT